MAREAVVATSPPAVEPTPGHACDADLLRAFQFLGKRWNGVLLGTLASGPSGFAGLRRALGISDSMLSDRLSELTRADLIERIVSPGPPVAVTYALSPAGRALVPALDALQAWAAEHLDPERCARAASTTGA